MIDDNRLEEGESFNGQRVRFDRACLYGIHVLQDDSGSNIVVIAVDFSKPSKFLQREFRRVINRNTRRRQNSIHQDLNIEQFFRCYDLRKQHGLKMSWREIAEAVYGDPRCASQARSNYYKVTRRLQRLENHG